MNAHRPVLCDEAVAALAVRTDGVYLDCTFGRGGHSREILSRLGTDGRLLAFDQDPAAVAAGQESAKQDPRFFLFHTNFEALAETVTNAGYAGQLDGVLFDLGVSSPQLDDAGRGFSFLHDGPLDMRMDPTRGESAAAWLARVRERELADVLREYGEERYAKRIARAVVRARGEAPITRTRRLADLVAAAHPAWEAHKHPATRSFQAIRIFLNRELEALERALPQALTMLEAGGRLAVISFHSLEDRIVKRFIREQSRGGDFPPDLPVPASAFHPVLRAVGKAVRPGEDEADSNPRARSAVLRVAEKV